MQKASKTTKIKKTQTPSEKPKLKDENIKKIEEVSVVQTSPKVEDLASKNYNIKEMPLNDLLLYLKATEKVHFYYDQISRISYVLKNENTHRFMRIGKIKEEILKELNERIEKLTWGEDDKEK